MTFCPNCGSRLPDGGRFCGNCGTAVADPSAPQMSGPPAYSAPPAYNAPPTYNAPPSYSGPPAYHAPPRYSAPPAYGPPGYGQPYAPRQASAFFGGDWAGAGIVTGIGVGAMFLIGIVAVLIGNSGSSSSIKASELIGGVFGWVSLAAGGSLEGGGVQVSFRPLGLTLVGYALMAILFLRRLRTTGPVTAVSAGLQTGRVGVVHLGAMLLVALLSHVEGSDGSQGKADVISTMFFGTVTLAIALLVVWIISLPGLLPVRFEYYRGLIAGPMRAVLFLIVASCAATIALILLLVLTESVGETGAYSSVLGPLGGYSGADLEYLWRPLISTLLLFLPTVAGWSVLYGMGVPLTFGSGNNSESVSILDLIDTDDRFWLWPVAVIALLIVTGIYSARRSPIAPNGRPIGWWLAAVLPAALFVLSLSASLSANSSGFERASIGFDLLFVLLLGAVYGIGAGMLGTFLVPRRPPMVMAGYPPAGYPPPGYPPAGFPPPPAFPTPPPSYPAPPTFGTPMPGFQPPPGYAQAAPSSPPAPTAPSTWSSPAPPPIPDPAPPSEPPTGVTPPPPSFPAAPPRED